MASRRGGLRWAYASCSQCFSMSWGNQLVEASWAYEAWLHAQRLSGQSSWAAQWGGQQGSWGALCRQCLGSSAIWSTAAFPGATPDPPSHILASIQGTRLIFLRVFNLQVFTLSGLRGFTFGKSSGSLLCVTLLSPSVNLWTCPLHTRWHAHNLCGPEQCCQEARHRAPGSWHRAPAWVLTG